MSMFGALNRFIARLDADPVPEKASHHGAYGFQVLRNANSDLAVEPWFDFVTGINGHKIDNADPNLFAREVQNCAGSSIELQLWSAKGARSRSLWVPVPSDADSIGLSLQWQPLSSTDDVWHVLDVMPNSPADLGGLLPYGDYIIGSPAGLLRGEPSLGELVENFVSRPLTLHVYNHEYNVTREVTLEPSRTWGGGGLLGCVFGFGALHRIPSPLDEPPHGPGETLFETARLSSDDPARRASHGQPTGSPPPRSGSVTPQYIVPADLPLGSPGPTIDGRAPPPKGSATGAGRKTRLANKATTLDMDEFLQEGEAKSREDDVGTKSKPATSLPPPPKAGAANIPPPPSNQTSNPPPAVDGGTD